MRVNSRSVIRVAAAAAMGVLLVAASPDGEKRLPTLDVGGMDPTAPACTDFYQYADGVWLKQNPIPSDRPRWGTFDELRQRNLNDLRKILERLAADKSAAAGSDERKLGDFYGACMDEAGDRVRGHLSRSSRSSRSIDAIKDRVRRCAPRSAVSSRWASTPSSAFGSEEDRKDASRVIAAALQGGLGLPERDYYLKTDEKSVKLREKYVAHVAKMLELAGGVSRRRRPRTRRRSSRFETRLADASQNNVDIRDPDKTHHPMTVATLSQDDAEPRMDVLLPRPARPARRHDQRVAARLLQGGRRDGQRPSRCATWKTYLRWHLLSAAAPSLSNKLRRRELRVLRQDARPASRRSSRAGSAASTATDGAHGNGARPDLREGALPAGGEAARRRDGRRTCSPRSSDDIKTLDWMSEETKKAAPREGRDVRCRRSATPTSGATTRRSTISPGAYAANVLAANAVRVEAATSPRSASRSTGPTGA